MGFKAKLTAGIVVLGLGAGAYAYWSPDREVVDTRYNGAYRLADGSIATLVPSTPERMRLRHADDGQVHSLYHDGQGKFQAAEGFSSRKFMASGAFEFADDGKVAGAKWVENDVPSVIERIPLDSEYLTFKSGDLRLRAKLILPKGKGPFPVVVMVHGSESYSAVDFYHLPYLLAAHGIAGLKFDKRGTGDSEGEYTQHFPTLAADVVAAVNLLKSRPDIDPERIHLAGFSQGGWIAPLVAKQTNIRSFLVGYGCAIPVQREDRWGYVKRLQDRGFGEPEIALADAVNEEVVAIVDHDDDTAWDRLFAKFEKHADDDWFIAIAGSDSILGIMVGITRQTGANLLPEFTWKMYYAWRKGDGPHTDRAYHPRTTLSEITTPSMWLLAGEDTSTPTHETTAVLDKLRESGKPVAYKVYDGAEHGNVMFSTDEEGERVFHRYAKRYFADILEWFEQQNGSTAPHSEEGD